VRRALFALALCAAPAFAAGAPIVVNAVPLSAEAVRQLKSIYPVPIKPGRYWYDAVSGAWGLEGGPIAGQMLPRLKLGGPLRADASRGTSGIFINGREITLTERAYLEQTCRKRTVPGRYWVNARGVGGIENGPPRFDLSRCARQQQRSGGSSTRTFCDPDGSCRSSGLWGSILTVPGR
jgi:hypothetical protein